MATRLGLIGRGKWGRNIERTLLSIPDVSVVVVGRNGPLRHDLDGILIASPGATHADLAVPYIEAGISVFIEKPMATRVADAERICNAASRSNAAVFVGHLQLYNPAFSRLLELLPTLGAVQYAFCVTENDNPRLDCSVLWDWLPHHLSMARAIFGTAPDSVQAWNLTASATPQAAASRFIFGGTSWLAMTSWLSPIRRHQLTIVAEEGTLVFDDRAERKLFIYGRAGTISYPDYPKELPLTRELQCFLRLVRQGLVDRSHVELGLAVTQAIAAAEDSAAANVAAARIRH
jgi:predicted dehydrogenase